MPTLTIYTGSHAAFLAIGGLPSDCYSPGFKEEEESVRDGYAFIRALVAGGAPSARAFTNCLPHFNGMRAALLDGLAPDLAVTVEYLRADGHRVATGVDRRGKLRDWPADAFAGSDRVLAHLVGWAADQAPLYPA